MSDFSVARGLEPFEWNHDEAVRYEVALEGIGEAVACYTALIDRAEVVSDQAEIARLEAAQTRCVEDQKALRSHDHEGIARVLDEYPALIRRLRAQMQ
jgi:hypothetical protein